MIDTGNARKVYHFSVPSPDRYLLTRYASGDDINFMMDSYEASLDELNKLYDYCENMDDYLYVHEPMYLPGGDLGLSIRMAYGYCYHYRIAPALPDMTGVFPNA